MQSELQKHHRYTLEELLAQCNESAENDALDKQWLETEPVGKELL